VKVAVVVVLVAATVRDMQWGLCSYGKEDGQSRALQMLCRCRLGGGKRINGWEIWSRAVSDKATDAELDWERSKRRKGRTKKLGRLLRSRGADHWCAKL